MCLCDGTTNQNLSRGKYYNNIVENPSIESFLSWSIWNIQKKTKKSLILKIEIIFLIIQSDT